MIPTATHTHRIAIIGGGIAGLSTAYYLQQQAAEQGIAIDYTLFEQAERWGGKVHTDTIASETEQPFVIEGGPDSFLTQKPWARQLAVELGLSDDLLGTNDAKKHVFVLVRDKPVVLPDGVLLIVPTKFMPFALSPLISPLGKLRMGLDLIIPRKADDADETLADFIRRRLGNEALDKIAEPLMSGIYNAEAEQQSILATFPRFRAIEKQYGSLTRGMLASKRKRETASQGQPSAPKTSAFMSLSGGTNDLIHALVNALTGDLRLNTGVRAIERDGAGYQIRLKDGTTLDADQVVLATPAYIASNLLCDLSPQAAQQLDRIRYVSTGTLSLAYNATDLPKPLNGFGVVIPGSSGRPINAITISSTKFDQRAPAGTVLLRVFFGGSRSPDSMFLGDAALLQIVRDELQEILGITAEPLLHRIYRWWNANPQYDLGHLERVDAIEAALPEGVFVTGSAYRGVGMPDCVHQAQQTATNVLEQATVHVAHVISV